MIYINNVADNDSLFEYKIDDTISRFYPKKYKVELTDSNHIVIKSVETLEPLTASIRFDQISIDGTIPSGGIEAQNLAAKIVFNKGGGEAKLDLQEITDNGNQTDNELIVAESDGNGVYSEGKQVKIGYQSGFDWKTQVSFFGSIIYTGETTLNSALRLQYRDLQANLYYDTFYQNDQIRIDIQDLPFGIPFGYTMKKSIVLGKDGLSFSFLRNSITSTFDWKFNNDGTVMLTSSPDVKQAWIDFIGVANQIQYTEADVTINSIGLSNLMLRALLTGKQVVLQFEFSLNPPATPAYVNVCTLPEAITGMAFNVNVDFRVVSSSSISDPFDPFTVGGEINGGMLLMGASSYPTSNPVKVSGTITYIIE
jgi:hypothetical protein